MRRIGNEFENYPDYFDWLCEMIYIQSEYSDESYWNLAKILWKTDFIWVLDMDEDRAADGIALRNRYKREGGQDSYDGPCTVLEVLIGLADRIDCILDELDGECRIPTFFWEMIDNLCLSGFSDQCFMQYPNHKEDYYRQIDRCLQDWMNRDIEYNGSGGIFPLKHPKTDQRNVTLWYQASAYILENYY